LDFIWIKSQILFGFCLHKSTVDLNDLNSTTHSLTYELADRFSLRLSEYTLSVDDGNKTTTWYYIIIVVFIINLLINREFPPP